MASAKPMADLKEIMLPYKGVNIRVTFNPDWEAELRQTRAAQKLADEIKYKIESAKDIGDRKVKIIGDVILPHFRPQEALILGRGKK
jgi:hypothetical protein